MPTTETSPTSAEATVAGLDRLETVENPRVSRTSRLYSVLWPKLTAVALALALWQLVVWSGWKPIYVLPPPATVFGELRDLVVLDHALRPT